MLAARNELKYRTKVVGVLSAHAKSYAESFVRIIRVASTVNIIIADGRPVGLLKKLHSN